MTNRWQEEDSDEQDVERVEIAAKLRHQTDKAYLLFDGTHEAWVPRSLTEDNEDGTWTMPEWLARDKGFI